MKYYAGIGSRETPEPIRKAMRSAAGAMAKAGVTLRTGGAKGADQAFFNGWQSVHGPIKVKEDFTVYFDEEPNLLELYLPYDGYNGFRYDGNTVFGPPTKEARLLAKKYHPNWSGLGDRGRDFHARNCYQVLGFDLQTPSSFVLCWTEKGKPVGGTAQAIRIAEKHNIPVFNLGSTNLAEASSKIMDIIND